MRPITLKSAARQVADHLRAEIERLSLTGGLPGPRALAEQLGVNHKTVEVALGLLEEEGVILAQGPGRRRKIQPLVEREEKTLRMVMMLHNRRDNSTPLLAEMRHRLREAGHAVSVAEKRVGDYSLKPERLLEWIGNTPADAWLIHSGPGELLEKLVQFGKPVFAIGGGRHGLPVAGAGPDKTNAMREAVAGLVSLGHQHIVMLGRKERLEASGGNYASAFLAELRKHGLEAGKRNLPTWNNQPSGFHRCVEAALTQGSATALIIDEVPLFIAAQQQLSRMGLSAPHDISMICTQRDAYLDWCRPSVAHFLWDGASMTRRVLQWAHRVACGRPDVKQIEISTSYVHGGTVGPAPTPEEPDPGPTSESTSDPSSGTTAELAAETV